MSSTEVFDRFVAAINCHDVDALAALMTEDHLFVDSLGNRIKGQPSMQAGWRGYFAMCPDYRIQIRRLLSDRDVVFAAGQASGTINGSPWQIEAAWEAVILGAQVAEWRVFADNKPVYEILARRKPSAP